MEPRQAELKKTTELHLHTRKKSRFHIVKLEERIAPSKGGTPGWCDDSGYCVKPCHGAHGKCFP